MTPELRTETLKIRLAPSTHAAVKLAAERAGVSMSTWVLLVITGQIPVVRNGGTA